MLLLTAMFAATLVAEISGTVVVILAAVSAVLVFLVRVFRGVRKFGQFLDDWNGEPATSGQPARRGVLDRLAAIEYQVHPNSGASMADRIEETQSATELAHLLARETHQLAKSNREYLIRLGERLGEPVPGTMIQGVEDDE